MFSLVFKISTCTHLDLGLNKHLYSDTRFVKTSVPNNFIMRCHTDQIDLLFLGRGWSDVNCALRYRIPEQILTLKWWVTCVTVCLTDWWVVLSNSSLTHWRMSGLVWLSLTQLPNVGDLLQINSLDRSAHPGAKTALAGPSFVLRHFLRTFRHLYVVFMRHSKLHTLSLGF